MASEIRSNSSTNSVASRGGDISNHSFDTVVQDMLVSFNQTKAKGEKIPGDLFIDMLNSLGDHGKVTREEFKDLQEWVEQNPEALSLEARKQWNAFQGAIEGFEGTQNWDSRLEVVLSGPNLAEALKRAREAGGASVNDADGLATGSAGGSHGSPAVNDPGEPEARSTSGTSATNADYGNMSWEALFAMILDLVDKKEKKLKEEAGALGKKINADTAKAAPNQPGPESGSLNADLSIVTGELKKLEQLVNMVTNMQKSTHDTSMAVIRSMA